MPPPPDASANTPLAPSVEKAYYRKCIELKRRLNEVEAANDEAKIRRTRLERGIMKMRLERAFLLDELKKRMDYNVDDSEGSGEETMATPPVDRPHRDKRRRHNPLPPAPLGPGMPMQQANAPFPRQPSDPQQHLKREYGQPEGMLPSQRPASGGNSYMPPAECGAPPPHQQHQPPPPPVNNNPYQQSSPYAAVQTPAPAPGPPPQRVLAGGPRSAERRAAHAQWERDMEAHALGRSPASVSRQAGSTGEAMSAGPAAREDANGERRVASSEEMVEPEGGFTAVNN